MSEPLSSRGLIFEVFETLHAGIVFVLAACWKWPVLSGIAAFLLALGVSAMYGDQYILAAGFYFVGIVMLTAKFASGANSHERKLGVVAIIVLLGAILFVGSLFWIRYTYEGKGKANMFGRGGPIALNLSVSH